MREERRTRGTVRRLLIPLDRGGELNGSIPNGCDGIAVFGGGPVSVQAISWVLDYSPTTKLDRLVLIALANHANESGECYPSVERIAREAGTTPVQARRVLGTLEDAGHITRTINGAPDIRMRGDRKTNLYRILDGGAQNVPPWMERPRVESLVGVPLDDTTAYPPARARATVERAPNHQGTITQPSVEPSGASAKRATSFPAEFFITDDMRQWAREHAPAIDVNAETAQFADYHRAKGDRMKDWVAAWRTWMRNAVKFSAQRGAVQRTKAQRSHAAIDNVVAMTRPEAQKALPL